MIKLTQSVHLPLGLKIERFKKFKKLVHSNSNETHIAIFSNNYFRASYAPFEQKDLSLAYSMQISNPCLISAYIKLTIESQKVINL